MDTKALSVQGLRKQYNDFVAVDGISFDVNRNEIVGLVGPNGAGKTTTISMLLGVLKPSAGTILIEGCNVATDRSKALSCANFAAVYAPLPGNLTVYQNLRIFGLLYGVTNLSERISDLLDQFDLKPLENTRCGVLSSGEQTRVCLAKAMLNSPGLLLLDEPTASLDPATAREMRAQIRAFTDNGDGGVLWTSHNMHEVESVCDRVLFLFGGKIVLEGDPGNLAREHGQDSLESLFVSLARSAHADGAV